MINPHLIYTCSKAKECAYARSHIGQVDNKDCQKCDNMDRYVPLGAVLYVAKHIDGEGSIDWARHLAKEGKQFTIDGDMIEDKVVTE